MLVTVTLRQTDAGKTIISNLFRLVIIENLLLLLKYVGDIPISAAYKLASHGLNWLWR